MLHLTFTRREYNDWLASRAEPFVVRADADDERFQTPLSQFIGEMLGLGQVASLHADGRPHAIWEIRRKASPAASYVIYLPVWTAELIEHFKGLPNGAEVSSVDARRMIWEVIFGYSVGEREAERRRHFG